MQVYIVASVSVVYCIRDLRPQMITEASQAQPAFDAIQNDPVISKVMRYVRKSWSNELGEVTKVQETP